MSGRREVHTSDESTSSSSTKYSSRSYETTASSPTAIGPEDSGYYPALCVHPIESSNPLIKQWDDFLEQFVMTEVRKLPQWVSVDVLRRGLARNAARCLPTIIITIAPDSMNSRCRETANLLAQYCDDAKIEIRVDLQEGELSQNVVISESSKAPGIGSSIATQGENIGTGTLGGYVRLERPGKVAKVCAMTCHHVLVSNQSGK